jgi:hypothetical protein
LKVVYLWKIELCKNGIPNLLEILNYSFHNQLDLKDPTGLQERRKRVQETPRTPGVQNNQAPKDPAGNK